MALKIPLFISAIVAISYFSGIDALAQPLDAGNPQACFTNCIDHMYYGMPTVLQRILQQTYPSQHLKVDRLVIVLYRVNDELNVYIPNEEKQIIFPHLPYEESDILQTINADFINSIFYNTPYVSLKAPSPHNFYEPLHFLNNRPTEYENQEFIMKRNHNQNFYFNPISNTELNDGKNFPSIWNDYSTYDTTNYYNDDDVNTEYFPNDDADNILYPPYYRDEGEVISQYPVSKNGFINYNKQYEVIDNYPEDMGGMRKHRSKHVISRHQTRKVNDYFWPSRSQKDKYFWYNRNNNNNRYLPSQTTDDMCPVVSPASRLQHTGDTPIFRDWFMVQATRMGPVKPSELEELKQNVLKLLYENRLVLYKRCVVDGNHAAYPIKQLTLRRLLVYEDGQVFRNHWYILTLGHPPRVIGLIPSSEYDQEPNERDELIKLLSEMDLTMNDDEPEYRIIGGKAATGSGAPLNHKGRSGLIA